jgi:hypothetical protein
MDSRLSTCLPQPRATAQALALSAGGQTWPRSVRSAGPSYDSSALFASSLSRFPALGQLCDLIVNSLDLQRNRKIARVLNEQLEQLIPSGFQFFQFNLSVVGICCVRPWHFVTDCRHIQR